MSKTAALARARSLREALLDHGVRKVSIELQQGRPGTPNGRWYDTRFIGEMSHHTVSRPASGKTPVLGLVKRGRSDVPGPLCNGYGGYDEIYRIICMGWANHPGAGGPLTVGGYRVPRNTGRPYLWGTEFEGGLEPWTDSMHEFMARSNAGILDWLGEPLSAHIEHSTWTSRKIDRLNYTAAKGRDRIKPYLGGGQGDDDMTPEQEAKLDLIYDRVRNYLDAPVAEKTNRIQRVVDRMNRRFTEVVESTHGGHEFASRLSQTPNIVKHAIVEIQSLRDALIKKNVIASNDVQAANAAAAQLVKAHDPTDDDEESDDDRKET